MIEFFLGLSNSLKFFDSGLAMDFVGNMRVIEPQEFLPLGLWLFLAEWEWNPLVLL